MGSARGNCPWCGRFEDLYSPDSVGYPICSEGDHSCLWYQLYENGILSQAEYFAAALRRRFDRPGQPLAEIPATAWTKIRRFLGMDEEAEDYEEYEYDEFYDPAVHP